MLHGERYLIELGKCLRHDKLRKFIEDTLPYYDYQQTLTFYTAVAANMTIEEQAFLGCNDRFFLLTTLLNRRDAMHPWVFSRCREVEDAPDGHLDLWARFHYKSTVGTFAGIIQEIMRDPEITVCILSCTQDIASAFLLQIQQEFERNERLKSTYPDVLWEEPSREASRWSRAKGIVVKGCGLHNQGGAPIGKAVNDLWVEMLREQGATDPSFFSSCDASDLALRGPWHG